MSVQIIRTESGKEYIGVHRITKTLYVNKMSKREYFRNVKVPSSQKTEGSKLISIEV